MTVQLFSLEGNLQVTGTAEAKAGLESVAAAGKEAAASLNSAGGGVLGGFPAATAKQMEILGQAETTFKKMGLAGEELENSMKAAARGMGVSMPAAAAEAEAAVLGAGVATAGTSEKVKEGTKTWAEHGRGLGETIERYRGLIEIYGLLKIVEFTSQAIDQAAALHELSQKTGATVEMLSILEFAGRRANVSAADLTMGFRGFALALESLSMDSSPKVTAAFTAIGLSAKDFQGLNTDEAFKRVVAALAPFPDGLDKAAVAAAIFGRSGGMLVPLLDDLGKNGFAKTTEEAKKFNAVIGKDASDRADQFKDSMGDLRAELEGVARVLIGPLNTGLQNLIALMTGNLHAAMLSFAKGFDQGSFGLFPSMFDHLTRKWAVEDSSNPEATGDPGHRAGRVLSPFEPGGDEPGKEHMKSLTPKDRLKTLLALLGEDGTFLDAPGTLPGGGPGRPVGVRNDRIDVSGGLTAPSPGGGGSIRGDAANKWYEDQLRAGEALKSQFANLGKNLGLAVTNSFATAIAAGFHGKNVFKAFGLAVVGALGNIFVQMGQAMILASPLFIALNKAMMNPITSGFALLAIGIALTALGMTLGGIASGAGGGGGGSGGHGDIDKVTQIHLTADGAGGWMAPNTHNQPVVKVLGKDSPEGQRLFAEYGGKAQRRGF